MSAESPRVSAASWPARLGGYDVVRPLSTGGMGAVLLAERRASGFTKRVAIKVILPRLLGDEHALGLFVDEARLAARFVHPNLVAVNDFGEEAGLFYMVMELVEGPSLLELCRRVDAPLPPLLAAQLIADAGRGLAWAHQLVGDDGKPLGVVHRDVSPDNIVVSDVGAVKVLDFGIAKSRMRQQVTVVTGLLGKPAYMSPERVYGDAVDERADCWSLGVILHELLSGRRLFAGKGVQQLEEVARGAIAPLPSSTPPALALLVERALQRALSLRVHTAEFVDGLDRFLREHNSLRTPAELRTAVDAIAPGIFQRRAPLVAVPAAGRPAGEATVDVVEARVDAANALADPTEATLPRVVGSKRATWPMLVMAAGIVVAVSGVAWSSRPLPPLEPAVTAPLAKATPTPTPTSSTTRAVPAVPAVSAPTLPTPSAAPSSAEAAAAVQEAVVQQQEARRALKKANASASSPSSSSAQEFGGIYVPDRTPWVEVLIDGTKVGVSPLGSARKPWSVAAGRHTITLFEPASGTTVATTTVVVKAGSAVAIRP